MFFEPELRWGEYRTVRVYPTTTFAHLREKLLEKQKSCKDILSCYEIYFKCVLCIVLVAALAVSWAACALQPLGVVGLVVVAFAHGLVGCALLLCVRCTFLCVWCAGTKGSRTTTSRTSRHIQTAAYWTC